MTSINIDHILACPDTKEVLTEGSAELLKKLNTLQATGKLKTVSGDTVTEPLERILVPTSVHNYCYPVQQGVARLMISEKLLIDEKLLV